MADNIQQQLKALATATEMGWMNKEDAGKEFKRLYAAARSAGGAGAAHSVWPHSSPRGPVP